MALSEIEVQVMNAKKRKHDEAAVEDNDSESSDDSEEDQDPRLCIVIRRVGKGENESLHFDLHSKASVLDLKKKIAATLVEQEETDIPVERQRLIFSGKMLRDDTQSLKMDLKMKPTSSEEEEHKNFVHLTPLPQGAAPSARTEREHADVETALSPHEVNMRRARRIGARQRRRQQEGQEGQGVMGAAAYHPYALDRTSGLVVERSSTANGLAGSLGGLVSASNIDAMLSAAATAEQSRRAQELVDSLRSAAVTEAVTNEFLQRQGLAAASVPSLGGRTADTSVIHQPCPYGNHAQSVASLLASQVPPPAPLTAVESLIHQYLQPPPPRQPTTAETILHAVLAPTRTTTTRGDTTENAASSLLQELLGDVATRPNVTLPDVLDQVAVNAGQLAATLRQLQQQPLGSMMPAATLLANLSLPTALAPQVAGTTEMSLQDQLAGVLASPAGQRLFPF